MNIIVCSHRGPLVYERSGQEWLGKRGGGGLIGAVAPVMEQLGGTWIAAALSDGDRDRATRERDGWEDASGYRIRLLPLPREQHELHYDVVSNEYLWFLFHYLFDVPNEPNFDARFAKAWDAYRSVNALFAEAVADGGRHDAVFVQDYQLMLVGAELRRRSRSRKPLLYFHHTPWCEPDYFGLLPDAVRDELLSGMLAFDVVGLHAHRWADAFLRCCERFVPRASVSGSTVRWRGRETHVVVAPVPLDATRVAAEASSSLTEQRLEWVDAITAGRRLLVRVDRIDLSKNPLRGFLAFERALEAKPKLAKDVLFLALLYPSRSRIEAYRRYFTTCVGVVRRINERFEGKVAADEGPITLHFEDDHFRALAALRRYDALLVNPVFDGLNLVAKEGAAVNERSGTLLLSRNAGVFEELGKASVPLNPFDVGGTSDAIVAALDAPATERQRQAKRLRKLATGSTPRDWVARQLSAAGLTI